MPKKTATAALIQTAVATPTTVTLHQVNDATRQSAVKTLGDAWVRTELF